MKKYLELIRIKHWIKNLLVFLPLFFNGSILNINKLLLGIIAFFIFSFTSSIIYIINDLFDLKNDQNHPIKKTRPLANNIITTKKAYITMIILFILICPLIICLYLIIGNILVFIIPLCYLIINIIYSYKLKNIPVIDIIIISLGFVLRVVYGGVCEDILVSKYLYLLIIFGSFYLAYGKRKGELINNNTKSREVLTKYNKDFLDWNMYVSYTVALLSYILWCVDLTNINKFGHDYMFWTIPLLVIVFQIYNLDVSNNSHADPVDILLNNKILIFIVLLYIAIMSILIYVV